MATKTTTAKAAPAKVGTLGVSAKAMLAAQAATAATRSEQLQAEADQGPVEPEPGVEDQGVFRDEVEGEEEGDVTTLVQHVVLVSNDPSTKVPTEIYDHEIPVLEAIHGEGQVEISSSEEIEVVDFTPEAEHDRMLRKYGPKNEAAVRSVFPTPNNLARELGIATTQRTGVRGKAQQEQSLSVDRRVKKTVATATTAKAKPAARVSKPSTKR